jgi:8-oxo-dGTP diphosphatase
VPDPVSRAFTAAEEAAWYAQLPTMFGAAGALFTDAAGRVLLVKPNYRDHWSLPGGILEDGEPPHEACRREVLEELGLDITPGRLLVVGWTGLDGKRPRPVLHFVFDGGDLAAGTPIRLQAEELDDYRFVELSRLDDYLPPLISARVAAAVRGRDGEATAYLPCPPPEAPAASER